MHISNFGLTQIKSKIIFNKKNINRYWIIFQTALYQAIPPAGQFLLAFVVIHYAGKASWGDFVTILLIINFLRMGLAWGSTTYLLRQFSEAPADMIPLWQKAHLSRSILLLPTLIILFYYLSTYPSSILIWSTIWLCLLFLFPAFIPIIFYERKFLVSNITEVIILILQLSILYLYRHQITSLLLIQLMVLGAMIRTMVYTIIFRSFLQNFQWQATWSFFLASLPFFLPSFIGFLQSRIDLYSVAYLLDKESLAAYQLFIKALFFIFVISQALITPYLKNIYRVKRVTIQKLHWRFFAFGLCFTPLAVAMIYILLNIIMDLALSYQLYIWGWVMTIPFFGYIIKTQEIIKNNRPYWLVWSTILAALCNIVLNAFLVPQYALEGAIIATTLVQWVLLIIIWLMADYSDRLRNTDMAS